MKRSIIACALFFIGTIAMAQTSKRAMKKLITSDLQIAEKQYKYLMKKLPDDVMPRSFEAKDNKLVTSGTSWWCSGFYPGTLWYLYEHSGDAVIREEAEKRLNILEIEKNNTGTHDLGFMMHCSFGNAFRITGNPAYKNVLNASALSLSTR